MFAVFVAAAALVTPTGSLEPQTYSGSQYARSRAAQVRVLNAIVDYQVLTIQIGEWQWTGIPYGQRTAYADVEVPSRRVPTHVLTWQGERLSNDVMIELQPAYPHTVILCGFVTVSGNFQTVVLRDSTAGRPSMSSAQFQFVNAMSDGAAVKVEFDKKPLNGYPVLQFGASTKVIGYSPDEYEVRLLSAAGQELYKTTFRANAGTRYTAVAMGAVGQAANRAPRLFFYSF
ncbi:MAG: hypothetical protein AKCLJLPJ_00454 [Fimbriimonadales bacterium]|nr:hypothetical protein [Fimbriimonadales bacterium]